MEFKIVSKKTITEQIQSIAHQVYGEGSSVEIIGDEDNFTIKIIPFNEIGMSEDERSNIGHANDNLDFKSKVAKTYKDHGKVIRYED